MSVNAYLDDLRGNFTFFIDELWKVQGYDRKAPLGPVEYDILDWLQNGPQLLGVLAPRSVGKTYWGTCGLAAWTLLREPDSRVIICAKRSGFAADFVRQVREWIDQVPFLQHLRPPDHGPRSRRYRDSTHAGVFDVPQIQPTKDPSIRAVGIDGSISGTRASLLIADDIEQPENTKTAESRRKLEEKTHEFVNICTYGEQRIVVIGTYHHEQSVYTKLSKLGYAFRAWPLEYPAADEQIEHLAPMIAERLAKEPSIRRDPAGRVSCTMPYRFDQEYVRIRRARGASNYAKQQMLMAHTPDDLRYPLKLSDLIVHDCQGPMGPVQVAWGTMDHNGSTERQDIEVVGWDNDRLHRPAIISKATTHWPGTRMRIDPAGRGPDQTAWAICSSLNGIIWCRCVRGMGEDGTPGADNSIVQQIVADMIRFRVHHIVIEENFGGDTFGKVLQPHIDHWRTRLKAMGGFDDDVQSDWEVSLEAVPARNFRKEDRIIDVLEPVLNQHRLVIDPEAVRPIEALDREYELQWQIASMTKERRDRTQHDDKIEALAECVWDLENDLRIDPETAAENNLQEMRMRTRAHELANRYARPGPALPRLFTHT